MKPSKQPTMLYIANGVLSAISNNVFVATVYINEIQAAFNAGTSFTERCNPKWPNGILIFTYIIISTSN